MTALPAFIDRDAWTGFCDMRKAIKKPLTPRAEMLILKTLYELKAKGHDPNAALDQSTVCNWQDVWEPRQKEITNMKREYNTTRESPMTEAERVASEEARKAVFAKFRPRRVA